MLSMYLQGLVRNIGISNFSIRKTQEVLSFCRIRPAVNQVGICTSRSAWSSPHQYCLPLERTRPAPYIACHL